MKWQRPGWRGWMVAFLCGLGMLIPQCADSNSMKRATPLNAEEMNQPPVAVALVNGLAQVVLEQDSVDGKQVSLDGSQSSDPDGDSLTYAWYFDTYDPSATPDSTETSPLHTYANGAHTATLVVTDPTGDSSTDTVSVTIVDTTAPAFVLQTVPEERGQLVEGCGSASFNWLQYSGIKFDVAFKAPKSGGITSITLQWKVSSGYGAGTLGRYRFDLCTNGSGNFPSNTVISSAVNVLPPKVDGAFTVPITATLSEGVIYHLVITNTDNSPRRNWSSPNTLMTRVIPWDGTGSRGAFWDSGVWYPWSSIDNIFNTTVPKVNDVNGSHCPLMLRWTDNSATGDPYYSALTSSGAFLYKNRRAGQFIHWDDASTQILGVGISIEKGGAAGKLYYHIENGAGVELSTGQIATNNAGLIPVWVYAKVDPPVDLVKGQNYRLWFNSPDSPDANNCYYQSVPYGETTPVEWLQAGWGGLASYYIFSATGTSWSANSTADLSFSLSVAGTGMPNVILEQASPQGTVATLTPPEVTDAADPAPSVTSNAPAIFPPGTTTVIWTAMDKSGNSSTCPQDVIVVDTTPPVVTSPADVNTEATSSQGTPVALGVPTVADSADPNPQVTNNAPARFPVGVTTVTWTATDKSGNKGTATQKVTITDTTPPVLTVPPDVSAQTSNTNGAAVNIGQATATDNGDATPTITNDAPALFPLGTTTVTWTAKDDSGNTATGTQRVTLTYVPPTFSIGIQPSTITLRSPLTTITYGVPIPATVKVTVYNSTGGVVRVLYGPATRNAGTYSVTWRATDSSGRTVKPGTYVAKVEGSGTDGTPIATAQGTITVVRR